MKLVFSPWTGGDKSDSDDVHDEVDFNIWEG